MQVLLPSGEIFTNLYSAVLSSSKFASTSKVSSEFTINFSLKLTKLIISGFTNSFAVNITVA